MFGGLALFVLAGLAYFRSKSGLRRRGHDNDIRWPELSAPGGGALYVEKTKPTGRAGLGDDDDAEVVPGAGAGEMRERRATEPRVSMMAASNTAWGSPTGRTSMGGVGAAGARTSVYSSEDPFASNTSHHSHAMAAGAGGPSYRGNGVFGSPVLTRENSSTRERESSEGHGTGEGRVEDDESWEERARAMSPVEVLHQPEWKLTIANPEEERE